MFCINFGSISSSTCYFDRDSWTIGLICTNRSCCVWRRSLAVWERERREGRRRKEWVSRESCRVVLCRMWSATREKTMLCTLQCIYVCITSHTTQAHAYVSPLFFTYLCFPPPPLLLAACFLNKTDSSSSPELPLHDCWEERGMRCEVWAELSYVRYIHTKERGLHIILPVPRAIIPCTFIISSIASSSATTSSFLLEDRLLKDTHCCSAV